MILATTKTRLLEYLDYKGITKSEFYSQTQIKRGLLDSDKLSATVPDTAIAKIIATYPDLNIVWLITGNGVMLRTQAASEGNLIEYLREKDRKIEELLQENVRVNIALDEAKKPSTAASSSDKKHVG